jgi:RNA polymerase sigma-70 factor (ECF subfamily)
MVSEAKRFHLALPARPAVVADRLSTMFHHHYDFVWRSVRRLGVAPDAVDDAAQEVFVVASRKLDAIEAGKEKAFLFGTAVRVASDTRRAVQRRRQAPASEVVEPVDAGPAPDELVEQLPEDTRPIFVLFELEGLTMAEIASCLELPAGTVASRLRRARELFAAYVARLEARRNPHG